MFKTVQKVFSTILSHVKRYFPSLAGNRDPQTCMLVSDHFKQRNRTGCFRQKDIISKEERLLQF
jgi:hypothetical protein